MERGLHIGLRESPTMRHKGHKSDSTPDRMTPDPVAAVIWQEGHLTGKASSTPVIKAPRAGDLAATDAA